MQLALSALSVAAGAWWLGAWVLELDLALVQGSMTIGALVAWAARRWLAVPQRQLAWTGSVWQVAGPDLDHLSGQADLMLDLGDWMLVRFCVEGGPAPAWRRTRWLPLRRRDSAAAWPSLRVALHAAQPAPRAA